MSVSVKNIKKLALFFIKNIFKKISFFVYLLHQKRTNLLTKGYVFPKMEYL